MSRKGLDDKHGKDRKDDPALVVAHQETSITAAMTHLTSPDMKMFPLGALPGPLIAGGAKQRISRRMRFIVDKRPVGSYRYFKQAPRYGGKGIAARNQSVFLLL